MQCYVVVLDKPLIHCWYLYCVAAVMVESREDEGQVARYNFETAGT